MNVLISALYFILLFKISEGSFTGQFLEKCTPRQRLEEIQVEKLNPSQIRNDVSFAFIWRETTVYVNVPYVRKLKFSYILKGNELA